MQTLYLEGLSGEREWNVAVRLRSFAGGETNGGVDGTRGRDSNPKQRLFLTW